MSKLQSENSSSGFVQVALVTLVTIVLLTIVAFALRDGWVDKFQQALEKRQREANAEKLRSSKSCPGCDLSEIDFTGDDLSGADLSSATLSSAIFTQANLSGANLSGADATFTAFQQADLTNSQLDSMGGTRIKLQGANLTGANITLEDLTPERFELDKSTILPSGDPHLPKLDLSSVCTTGEGIKESATYGSNADFHTLLILDLPNESGQPFKERASESEWTVPHGNGIELVLCVDNTGAQSIEKCEYSIAPNLPFSKGTVLAERFRRVTTLKLYKAQTGELMASETIASPEDPKPCPERVPLKQKEITKIFPTNLDKVHQRILSWATPYVDKK